MAAFTIKKNMQFWSNSLKTYKSRNRKLDVELHNQHAMTISFYLDYKPDIPL